MVGKSMSNIRAWVDDRFGVCPREYDFNVEQGVISFRDERWKGTQISFLGRGQYAVTVDRKNDLSGVYRSQPEVINYVLIPLCNNAYQYV